MFLCKGETNLSIIVQNKNDFICNKHRVIVGQGGLSSFSVGLASQAKYTFTIT